MSANLPSHYVSQFATNVMGLLQQKGSILRSRVDVGTHYGKQASPVDQIGVVEMQPVTGRFQPIDRVDATVTRRWVQPNDFDLAQIIDSFDKLRLLTDPSSVFVQNAVYAAGRQADRLILAAIDGTNYIGETGTATVSLPSGQKVAIGFEGSTTSLTVKKLIEARRILMTANVDLDDPRNKATIVVNATQMGSLLREASVTSRDYNGGVPTLVDGRITHYMGFDFVHTELLQAINTSVTSVPVFVQSGVHLGLWADMITDIDRRKDLKGQPWQAYLYMTMGATRIEEGKVVQIAAHNTVTTG